MFRLVRFRSFILTGILITSLLTACGTGQTTTSVATTEAVNSTAVATEPAVTESAAETTETGNTSAATSGTAEDTTPRIVAAANAFLGTLSDTEKDAVLFDWTDTAQKQRWSNLRQGTFQRAGLMWGDISEAQQEAWLQLMQATLSTEGYNRVIAEWNADDQLTSQGGGGGPGGG